MNANDNQAPIQIIEIPDEMAAVLQHQYELDRAEAGPKLPVDHLIYRGVELESRFSVAAEFDQMKAVVDAMPDLVRVRVESIWCDSRACSDYRVAIDRWIDGIDRDIRNAFWSATEGFNGLTIDGGNR